MPVDLTKIRNIGIAAHIDAGKTTTTERILYYTGRVHRMGEVDEGTTTTDFDAEEQQRGITIYSAAVSCPWRDCTINLIDTPGHVDFTAEVERSLRVLDGAVAVFDAREGVEAQSETVWRQANKYHVPRVCFINKMDKIGADFFGSLQSIEERLHARPVPLQIPIGAESEFVGVIDLVPMKAVYYQVEELGARFEEQEIPPELIETARHWRHRLEERVAELDDSLMEKFVHEQPIGEPDLKAAIRRATIANKLQPVLCGSALKYVGIQRMLDAVCDYLPSPLDAPPVIAHSADGKDREVKLAPDPDGPFVALVFKIVAEKPVDLYFIRIYSGTLKTSTRVYNPATRGKENISRIFRMFAKKRDQLDEAVAGDIVAVIGPKDALTGHTLCDARHPVLLEPIVFPATVISRSIEPKSSRDRDKLGDALRALQRQDPTFTAAMNPETGQTLISGMGELHLEIIANKLMKDMNVPVNIGQPRVSYRETITAAAEAEGRFIRQTGGRGHYAVVRLRIEPRSEDSGFRVSATADLRQGSGRAGVPPASAISEIFENQIKGGAISAEYIPAIEAGVRDAALNGSLGGYPVVNWKVSLFDGAEHEVDSSELAFENAGRLAFNEAVAAASPVLLEPIMKVEVVTPEDYLGAITGDLNARRAVITDTRVRGQYCVIDAEVPLREMFGYVTTLRSLSQGRATSTMEPLRYAPVPERVAREILGSF
ncbi:MAG TPA: elongation factor G [Phycisphaerae bacterium]|jgi:elongation factor G